MNDVVHMRHALRLARRSLGETAPNPAVGCVIVSAEGYVVGRGRTARGGRPHAEAIALAHAGNAARGGAAFISLEPCAHHGQTPPCAEALVKAGLARVVVAVEDPDPRVSGRGLEILREAGVAVTSGTLSEEASTLNLGFFRKVLDHRPMVTLKLAQTLDGKTASASGDSKWITGEEARRVGHLLRAQHDAVLVGIETALADDPLLNCRISGLEDRSPVRVVLDSRLRLPEESQLARTARDIPTLLYCSGGTSPDLKACGIEIVTVQKDARGRPDIAAVLHDLAERGMTRLLVEGGAGVHAAFLDRGMVDRIEAFVSAMVLGEGGHSGVGALAALTLDEAPRFRAVDRQTLGQDLLVSFRATA